MKIIFLLIGLVLFPVGGFAEVMDGLRLQEEQLYNGYTVRIYQDEENDQSLLRILRGSTEIYSVDGYNFRIEEIPGAKLINQVKDITGDGEPDLVVSHFSGGAHCCSSYSVFSMGKTFRLLDEIEMGDSLLEFKDIDKDGVLECIGRDYAFGYWYACFAGSPCPEVILQYRDGKYRLALDLMKRPLPLATEEQKLLEQIREKQKDMIETIAKCIKDERCNKDKKDGHYLGDLYLLGWVKKEAVLPSLVWAHMLDLIYTGHSNEAWDFLDKAWSQGAAGKEDFIKEFKEQLAKSQFWDSLKEIL